MDTASGWDHRREVEVIRRIAETMRSEFGDSIDAHPGGAGSDAGAINRAFRIAASVILKETGSPDGGSGLLAWVMRQVAMGRLLEIGVSGTLADALLDLEPGFGDAWLLYVALAPASVVDDLLEHLAGREDPGANPKSA